MNYSANQQLTSSTTHQQQPQQPLEKLLTTFGADEALLVNLTKLASAKTTAEIIISILKACVAVLSRFEVRNRFYIHRYSFLTLLLCFVSIQESPSEQTLVKHLTAVAMSLQHHQHINQEDHQHQPDHQPDHQQHQDQQQVQQQEAQQHQLYQQERQVIKISRQEHRIIQAQIKEAESQLAKYVKEHQLRLTKLSYLARDGNCWAAAIAFGCKHQLHKPELGDPQAIRQLVIQAFRDNKNYFIPRFSMTDAGQVDSVDCAYEKELEFISATAAWSSVNSNIHDLLLPAFVWATKIVVVVLGSNKKQLEVNIEPPIVTTEHNTIYVGHVLTQHEHYHGLEPVSHFFPSFFLMHVAFFIAVIHF
jgi:hypothetical protein